MRTLATLLASTISAALSAQDVTVRDVPLRVDTVRIAVERTIIASGVRDGANGGAFVAFVSGRQFWTVDRNLRVTTPSRAGGFPRQADHFNAVCAAGSRVLVQVGSYPDSVREKDEATPRGGFRQGPTPLGVAVLTQEGMTFIDRFRVVEHWPGLKPAFPDSTLPAVLMPMVQSCHWNGRELIVGAYGFAAALNLDNSTARLLTLDGELAFNRHAVHLQGDTLWTSEDEGGASGGCVERQVRGRAAERFCVMGYNNSEIGVDGLVSTRLGLISSSAAGLVEIRAADSSYTHFQISTDKRQMNTFAARCVGGALIGLRDDGIVIADLRAQRAKLVQIGDRSLGSVYSVERVGRHWLIGADSGVVVAKLPVPGWRPWRRSTC